jgi:hypothetical protein
MDTEVLYVINSATKEVSVIGDFGTHPAKLLSYMATGVSPALE